MSLKLGSGCQNTYKQLPYCRAKVNIAQRQHLQLDPRHGYPTCTQLAVNYGIDRTITLKGESMRKVARAA